MEDSLKGVLVATTLVLIFMTAIINFIVIFPQEQGVTFTGESQTGYLVMQNHTELGIESSLNNLSNQSSSGFDQWDITQGFMGSNALKQGTSEGTKYYSSNPFNNLLTIAKQLFGANSPIVWVITILLALLSAYLFYLTVKWIKTGT